MDWKDNTTIFRHDVITSDNSGSAHYIWGRQLLFDLYRNEKDKTKKMIYLDNSIQEFTKAITIYDYYPNVYPCLALAYQYKKDYKNSINSYETALKMEVHFTSEQFYNLGSVYAESGQPNKALSCFDSAIRYNPGFGEAYNNRGNTLSGLSRYQEAFSDYKKAIELGTKIAVVYKNMGSGYANLKQYQEAIKCFNKSIELDSSDIENFKFLGMVYQLEGDTTMANKYFEKVGMKNSIRQK